MWGEAAQCAIPTEASRGAGRAAGRLFEAAEFLLCRRGLPEANDAGIVSVSIAAGLCGGRGGSDHSARTRSDTGQSEATAHDRGSEPPYGGTMAAMVAGGISADVVLEMGERTDGHAGWKEDRLPLSLLESFRKPGAEERTIDLLRFILPLTTTSVLQET